VTCTSASLACLARLKSGSDIGVLGWLSSRGKKKCEMSRGSRRYFLFHLLALCTTQASEQTYADMSEQTYADVCRRMLT
jgi:hypothetical protein